ncbi:hypothetical protein GGI00_002533, partial [Coemansia sp. RSA 2681]
MKLEFQIALQENPVVMREGQDATVIRGHVTVISRQVQPARQIHLLFTGTKVLANTQQMGSASSAKRTLIKETKILEHSSSDYAIDTYTLPFEFVVSNQSLPPTLHVPRCTIDYTISATALKYESAPPLLRLFSAKAPKAQVDVSLVRYLAHPSSDPGDFVARQRPVVRIGTLGAHKNGRGALPYRITMDKNVAAPGDVLNFTLDVYPPGAVPPGFTSAELAALIDIASSSRSSKDRNHEADSDQDSVSADSGVAANIGSVMITSDATDDNDDNREMVVATGGYNSLAGSGSSSLVNGLVGGAPVDRPPTYRAEDKSEWAKLAATSLSSNKSTVAAYKVRAKLVQRVCYMADHDLVADSDSSVYLFWTKRVVAKECVSDCLDVTQLAGGRPLEWSLAVPNDLQSDVMSSGIQ